MSETSAAIDVEQRPGRGVTVPRRQARSRMTNGSTLWLDNMDKRGPVPRRSRDIVGLVTSDLLAFIEA